MAFTKQGEKDTKEAHNSIIDKGTFTIPMKTEAEGKYQKKLLFRKIREDYFNLLNNKNCEISHVIEFLTKYRDNIDLLKNVWNEYKSIDNLANKITSDYLSGQIDNELDIAILEHKIKLEFLNDIKSQISNPLSIPIEITEKGPTLLPINVAYVQSILKNQMANHREDFYVNGEFPLNRIGDFNIELDFGKGMTLPLTLSTVIVQAPLPEGSDSIKEYIEKTITLENSDIRQYIYSLLDTSPSKTIEDQHENLNKALAIAYKAGFWKTSWVQDELLPEWRQAKEAYKNRKKLKQVELVINELNSSGPIFIPEEINKSISPSKVVGFAQSTLSNNKRLKYFNLVCSPPTKESFKKLIIPIQITWKGLNVGILNFLHSTRFLPSSIIPELISSNHQTLDAAEFTNNTELFEYIERETRKAVGARHSNESQKYQIRANYLAGICGFLLKRAFTDEIKFKQILTSYYAAKGGTYFLHDSLTARKYYLLFFRMLYQEEMLGQIEGTSNLDFPILAAYFETFSKNKNQKKQYPREYTPLRNHKRLGPQVKMLWRIINLYGESPNHFYQSLFYLYEIHEEFVRIIFSDLRTIVNSYKGFDKKLKDLELDSNKLLKNIIQFSLIFEAEESSLELLVKYVLSSIDVLDISQQVQTSVLKSFKLAREFKYTKDVLKKSDLYTKFDQEILQVQNSVDQLRRKARERRVSQDHRIKQSRLKRLLKEMEKAVKQIHLDFFKAAKLEIDIDVGPIPQNTFSPVDIAIKNVDYGLASNILLHIDNSSAFESFAYEFTLDPIYGNSIQSEALYISPNVDDFIELQGFVEFSDQELKGKKIRFQKTISVVDPTQYNHFSSPYITGEPVRYSNMFFGRRAELEKVIGQLQGHYQDRPTVIHGRRRIGKTSILFQLKQGDIFALNVPSLENIRQNYIPVIVNFERVTSSYDTRYIYAHIYEQVRQELDNFNILTPAIDLKDFKETPADILLDRFMNNVGYLLEQQSKKMLLMFDEFDALIIHKGEERGLFGFIRDLVTKYEYISLIFVGADELVEMMQTRTRRLYSMAIPMEIKDLEENEAKALIKEPIKDINPDFGWAKRAIDSIIHHTSRHPYYIQTLCDRITNNLINEKRLYVTYVDVEKAVKEVVSIIGDLADTVNSLQSIEERIILTCLSELTRHERGEYIWVSGEDVNNLIQKYTSQFDSGTIPELLRRLQRRYILDSREDSEGVKEFCVRVPLLRIYIQNSYTLKDTLWEGNYT